MTPLPRLLLCSRPLQRKLHAQLDRLLRQRRYLSGLLPLPQPVPRGRRHCLHWAGSHPAREAAARPEVRRAIRPHGRPYGSSHVGAATARIGAGRAILLARLPPHPRSSASYREFGQRRQVGLIGSFLGRFRCGVIQGIRPEAAGGSYQARHGQNDGSFQAVGHMVRLLWPDTPGLAEVPVIRLHGRPHRPSHVGAATACIGPGAILLVRLPPHPRSSASYASMARPPTTRPTWAPPPPALGRKPSCS